MARRVRAVNVRDYKIEVMKKLMDLLATKGYATNVFGLSMDRFKFYCESVGGVFVKNLNRQYCKRKDYEFIVIR
jgi:hypothetical protein